MSSDFVTQGQLSATLFPKLAREIHERKLSGSLTLARGAMKRVLQFAGGGICGTASNLPQDSIPALLLAAGRINQAQADAIRQQTAAGKPLGEALLESGNLSREELAELRSEQLTRIIGSLYEWDQGEYQFEEGSKPEAAPGLPVPDLLLGGARHIRDTEKLWRLLGGQEAKIQLAPSAMERCEQFRLLPHEGYLLTRLDAPMTLADLMMISGLPEDVTLSSLYALECAELIVRDGGVRAPVSAATAAAPAIVATPARSEPARTTPPTAEAVSAAAAPVPPAAPPSPAPPPAPAKAPAEEASLEEIVQMAQMIAETHDDYQILGLTPSATRAEVKQAYTKLTKKYHPDRYHRTANDGVHAALKEVIAGIRKAYERLRDRDPVVTKEEPPAPKREEPVIERFDHGGAASTSQSRPPAFESNATPTYSPAPAQAAPATPPPQTAEPTPPQAFAPPAAAAPASGPVVDSPIAGMADEGAHSPAAGASAETGDDESRPFANTGALTQHTAELNFRHAIARYQSGDLSGATELMTTAVQLDPNNAWYHDQLATMLAVNPRRRKEAETHLLRAIEIEPQQAEWHVHLGVLYKTLGFLARAEGELKRALAIDSGNAAAQKELRAVKALKNPRPAEADKGDKDEGKADSQKPGASSVGDFFAKAKETSVSDLFSKFLKRK